MTTAEKKSPEDRESPTPEPGAPVLGFGKLLNSIGGLQQRLGDFSIDDVTRAEDTANTLIRRLAMLRNRLERIAEIKNAFADVKSAAGRLGAADLELIGAATGETGPLPQAIIDAGKIVQLHRFLKAVPAVSEPEFFEASPDPIGTTESRAKQESSEPVTGPAPSEPETEIPAASYGVETRPASGAIPLPPPSAWENLQPEHAGEATPSETANPPAPAGMDPELARNEADPISSSPLIAEPLPENAAAKVGQKVAIEMPAPAESTMEIQTAPESASELVSRPADTVFDRRLLDDLIENYGELISYPGADDRPEPAPSAKPEDRNPRALPPPSDFAPTNTADDSAARAELDLPPEPNFIMPEPAPAVEAVPMEPVETRTPSVRAADLDRQLKKIIEDYGEYDLYSRPASRNFKKSGIVAFIILGLVLFGVYFLKSPAQSVPTQAGPTLHSSPAAERPAENINRKAE
jgi:hypothetical protein